MHGIGHICAMHETMHSSNNVEIGDASRGRVPSLINDDESAPAGLPRRGAADLKFLHHITCSELVQELQIDKRH
jgi:hypothetical protein